MKCPHCHLEITDYEGRCLSCEYYGSSDGGEYCRKSKNHSKFFSSRYDGSMCEDYKYNDYG